MLFFAFSAPLSLFLLLFSPPPISSGTDQGFYELLGVPPDADLRAIRRAFKRLALERHPDKNPVGKSVKFLGKTQIHGSGKSLK